MKEFNIYFSDLNEDAQKRLLERVGVETPADMNWDIDICPIAVYTFEEEEERPRHFLHPCKGTARR